MEHTVSVLFLYRNEQRLEFQLYAEFLRLMGIYVCEKAVDEDERTALGLRNSDFTFTYQIEGSLNVASDEEKINKLNELKESLTWDADFLSCYETLLNKFIAYDLFRAGTVLQYFRVKDPLVGEAGRNFENTADELARIIKEEPEKHWEKNRYMRYANLYCKYKANYAQYLCDEPMIYYIDKLKNQGMLLTEEFKDFSNAWVLLGLVCKPASEYFVETIEIFYKAVSIIGNKPYVSSVYYWLGSCLESSEGITQNAKAYYKKAYDILRKYRNVYKVAMPYMQKNEWDTALRYFLECLAILEKKRGFMDPLEQEYYFKVSVQVCYCYMQLLDYHSAYLYVSQALRLRREIEGLHEEKDFFDKLYGEKAQKYRGLTLKRMKPDQAEYYEDLIKKELGLETGV